MVVVSRKADACEQVAKQLAADYGVETLPRAAHVGRWAELDGLVEDAYDHRWKVDVLVNNAGMLTAVRQSTR